MIKYTEEDVWSMGPSLAKLIAEMAKDFKSLDTRPVYLTPDDWDYILETIITGFEAVEPIMLANQSSERVQMHLLEKFEAGMSMFSKYFFEFWS